MFDFSDAFPSENVQTQEHTLPRRMHIARCSGSLEHPSPQLAHPLYDMYKYQRDQLGPANESITVTHPHPHPQTKLSSLEAAGAGASSHEVRSSSGPSRSLRCRLFFSLSISLVWNLAGGAAAGGEHDSERAGRGGRAGRLAAPIIMGTLRCAGEPSEPPPGELAVPLSDLLSETFLDLPGWEFSEVLLERLLL